MIESYGAELELADIDRNRKLPEGFGWDTKDFSMVNSNGIAVDPTGRLHDRGGEIQTKPTTTIREQVENFRELMYLFPEATVNYRSNLHIHARIPGLRDDLEKLKSLQTFIHTVFRNVVGFLEPIPRPLAEDYPTFDAMEGAIWRYNRRKKSHQTFLTPTRLAKQMSATSVKEFFELEVPTSSDGKVMWHAQPRCCVNLRQLLQTNTVEFRHFPGTTSAEQFRAALQWVFLFISAWEAGADQQELNAEAVRLKPSLPKFQPYKHELEEIYCLTTHDGTIPRAQLTENIRKFQANALL